MLFLTTYNNLKFKIINGMKIILIHHRYHYLCPSLSNFGPQFRTLSQIWPAIKKRLETPAISDTF